LLAIIGPSGAGKTTLLNTLAGNVPVSQHMSLRGSVTVNGVPIDRASQRQGYVQQEDIFYSQLTVRSVHRSLFLFHFSIFPAFSFFRCMVWSGPIGYAGRLLQGHDHVHMRLHMVGAPCAGRR